MSSCQLSSLEYLCKYLKLKTKQKGHEQVQSIMRGGEREEAGLRILKMGSMQGTELQAKKEAQTQGVEGTEKEEREKVPQPSRPGRKLATENVPLTSFVPVSLLPPSQQFGGFGETSFSS